MYWLRQLFSRPSVHFWSIAEVLLTFILAVSPFAVTFLVLSAKNAGNEFLDVSSLVARGQLYLLAYGLLGPVLWLAFVKPDVPRHNARVFLGIVAIIALIPVVGFLGVDPTFSTIQNEMIVRWSYWYYAFFLFVNYLLIFFCNILPPDADQSLDRGSAAMRDRYFEEFPNEQ